MLTLCQLALGLAAAAPSPVLVGGATGQMGSRVYLLLKSEGFAVRGLVRNAFKARRVLGCDSCGEEEGIFVGDVTKPATLVDAVKGTGLNSRYGRCGIFGFKMGSLPFGAKLCPSVQNRCPSVQSRCPSVQNSALRCRPTTFGP
jgi:hypothetical protein